MSETVGDVDVTLVPRIYGGSELGVLSLTAPGASHPRVEYVGGDLFVGLDDATDRTALTQAQADGLARPFAAALATALPEGAVPVDAADGTVIITDEAAAAAVLLDPARLPASAVTGAPVVFALSRQCLAVIAAEDEAAVARVLDLAEELFDAGAPLVSAHPIVRTDEGWAPFPVRERFPDLELRVERMLRLFSVRAYEVQTAALQRPDVHIAEAKIQVLESGVTTTFAAWPKGTATLLPVVDNVIIADPSGQLSVATLHQFLDAAGDAVVRTGLSPARYFVPGDQPRTS